MKQLTGKIFILIITLSIYKVHAQSDMISYGLYKTLPQSNNLNPALLPDYKFTLSLPGISGFKLNASQNFTSLELLTAKDADGNMDIAGIYDKLKNNNRITTNLNVPILNLGFRNMTGYTAFSVNLRTFNRFSIPKDLVSLAYLGNASEETRDLNFDNLSFKSNTFTEIGLSHGREILSGKMTVGARVKYLIGNSYTDVKDFNLAFRTFDDDSIRMSTEGFTLRTGGVAGWAAQDGNDSDVASAALAAGGLAFDLGASYEFNTRIDFFASINDLGYIRWGNYTRSYEIPGTSITFSGIDIINESFDDIGNELDSTFDNIDIAEIDNEKFTSALTANIYLGGSYEITKRQKAFAILYTELYKGKLVPAFTGMYNYQYNTFFNVATGVTIMNNRINNISTGFTLKLIPFQLCLATNDLFSLLNPMNGRAVDLRFGINFTFGDIFKAKRKSENTIDSIDLGLD